MKTEIIRFIRDIIAFLSMLASIVLLWTLMLFFTPANAAAVYTSTPTTAQWQFTLPAGSYSQLEVAPIGTFWTAVDNLTGVSVDTQAQYTWGWTRNRLPASGPTPYNFHVDFPLSNGPAQGTLTMHLLPRWRIAGSVPAEFVATDSTGAQTVFTTQAPLASPVVLPDGALLFGSGLMGLGFAARRKMG